MTEELKRCPFCGSEAEFGYYRDEEGIDYGCMYCNGCEAKITWDYGDEERTIEAWNRRVDNVKRKTKKINNPD